MTAPSLLLCLAAALAPQEPAPETIRVGMIGLDTSHVPAFTDVLNDPDAAEDVAGCPVVAAYPPGSELAFALERRERYTADLRGRGVEIVETIPALLERVDAVLLMTVDGRPHLEQALPVLRAGVPLYVDKPLAGSLEDALVLMGLAERWDVPIFTASSLRWAQGAQEARAGAFGAVLGADAYSPCTLEEHHPDLFWYGVHGVELLYTAMGPGCTSVVRTHAADTDVVVGTWAGGRIGTFRGLRAGRKDYGGTVFGAEAIAPLGPYTGYRPLVVEIVRFLRTGTPPVDAAESLELFTFMEAADESKRRGGAPVRLEEVLAPARAAAQARMASIER